MKIIKSMPIEEYHLLPGVSSTGLNQAHVSALRYKNFIDKGMKIGAKSSLEGNLIHCAILEPDELYKRYVVAPKFDKRTTAGKKDFADFESDNAGKDAITIEQEEMALAICENVYRNSLFPRSFQAETSILWNDSDTGLDCRCRPDLIKRGDGLIIDVKSTTDARKFYSSVQAYGYHRQEAFYRMGLEAAGISVSRFLFMAVEKEAPYDVIFYELDSEYIAKGELDVRSAMATVSLATRTGKFPGYQEEIISIPLPSFMRKDFYSEGDTL